MTSIKLITSHLIDECLRHIEESETIYLLISFTMISGVDLIESALREAAHRGADIKFLTGDYLFVTQPEALADLIAIHPGIEVRLWKSAGVSFHPKAYIFRKAIGDDAVIVGSSNLSRSALTTGVEWNLAVAAPDGDIPVNEAEVRFLKMFYSESTVSVNAVTIAAYEEEYELYHSQHMNLAKAWSEAEELATMFEDVSTTEQDADAVHDAKLDYPDAIELRPAQEEALAELASTRDEGYDKALVVMATGLGKTFLAALFAKDFRRVLFIAHREEILVQAQRAFARILPERRGGLFTGTEKKSDGDIVFASVMTLARKHHRTQFPPDHFDLIVVDEFHHAAATSYQAVIDWFQPDFLLGITATPDRTDARDVYAICDGNVAYRMDFVEAIQRRWLSPFHYIGVYDETDYSRIRWLGSRYDEQELLAVQTRESMATLAYSAWQTHKQTRAIAFCSSVVQAQFLQRFFQSRGVSCVCLHGGSSARERAEAIQKLNSGDLELIFTVDLFNEGVDIPAVDTLLFVRPTESLTVFTQQVGRGLRIHEGKTHCAIIDLIGNYRNADIKLGLFDAAQVREDVRSVRTIRIPPSVPDECSIDLDLRVIDLIRVMRSKRHPRKDLLREGYLSVKRDLGRRPTYLEMHLHGSTDSKAIKQEYGGYFPFLSAIGELGEREEDVLRDFDDWFREVESTRMTKSYKMVLLHAMLERGEQDWPKPISPGEVAPFFHAYYVEKEYRRRTDFNDRETQNLIQYDQGKVANLIAEMPMTKWSGSSKGIARFSGTEFWFELDREDLNTDLFKWTREICLYRLHVYFERKRQAKS
ncbi:DEAD/DEAH box helicase family protein [Alicyclobacillus sp. ALC3]|uniref:DEAD/DEAH box helicase family protein n=1 Tax=Alicyclobacillus sp. ALC3 TaxID=2796143 RepID=UPI002378C8AB|nr:DEAD/DEAH box helicase family protein [Alicyclobacillus sp. ALC3]WDL99110.1 DEAD/DEAH box helicase family protein [Alicyclobacillus sp. ALC3]